MRFIHIKDSSGHRGNCVPATLSALLKLPYHEVNNWMVYRGYRTNNSGSHGYRSSLRELGFKWMSYPDKGSVNQFSLKNTTGVYALIVSRHMLGVDNGIVRDNGSASSGRSIIKEVYYLEEARVPSDWDQAQVYGATMEKIRLKKIKDKENADKIKQQRKEKKLRRRALVATPEYRIKVAESQLKRWASKMKRAQTAMKKLQRRLKRLKSGTSGGRIQLNNSRDRGVATPTAAPCSV